MAEGRSLSERLRDLRMREAAEADEEALARAQREKASLYEHMRDASGAADGEGAPDGHSPGAGGEGDDEGGGGDARRDRGGDGGDGGGDGDDEGERTAASGAEGPGGGRADGAAGGDAGGNGRSGSTPKDVVRDFIARSDTLSGRLVALQQQGGHTVAREGSGAAGRSRALDWFLGKAQQEPGEAVVTRIPPYDGNVWEELEFYSIEKPFSFVRLLRNRATHQIHYEAIEPTLSAKEQQVLQFVEDALVRGLNVDPGDLAEEERLDYLMGAVRQILQDYMVRITRTGQARVEYYVRRDFLGLGPIHVLMRDPSLEDISCDGPGDPLWVFHRDHESITTNVHFRNEAALDGFVIKLAQRSGKAISISDPILDAALPDGSRLQATLGQEVTQNGSTFTIRRFKPDPFTPIDLVGFGTMDARVLAWFWIIVQYGASLIFSGGTASGKTTALNAISQFIPFASKIVSIEDTREVNLPHKNWIKSVTRAGSTQESTGEIGMFELLKAALRQRPEYILVGEVRGVEATVAFQAMATGHTVYATMHADSARSVVYRLENDPINIPRLVLQALDVIAIQGQVRHGGQRVRRIKEVVELVGMDPSTRELLTNTVFTWRPDDDGFSYNGRSYLMERIAVQQNWTSAQMVAEFERRQRIVAWLQANDRVDVDELGVLVRAYYRDPAAFAERVEGGESLQDILAEQGRLEGRRGAHDG